MAQVTISTSTGADGISSANATFSTARNAASGGTGNEAMLDRLNAGTYTMTRHFYYFDLSTTNIPAGATITAVTFVHPAIGGFQNADTDSIYLTAHTANDPADANSFNDITLDGATSFGTETFANLNTGSPVNVTMNAAGIAAAQAALGGTWKVCMRGGRDYNNSAPTGLNQYTFTNDDVDLIVTYTTASTTQAGSFYFM